jgi:hypothetical protein
MLKNVENRSESFMGGDLGGVGGEYMGAAECEFVEECGCSANSVLVV